MINILKLKAARVEADLTMKKIADEIGLNPTTVYRKFDGKSEFTVSEMVAIKKILHLDNETFCNIFFGDELAETQRNVRFNQ